MKKHILWILMLWLTVVTSLTADEQNDFRLVPSVELGYTAILGHWYRSGDTAAGNTVFDFVRQGGQDNLYLFTRFTVDAVVADRHRFTLLYQPLTINTKTVAERNGTAPVKIDGVAFAAGTPIDIKYGFDFYRLSYLYDFVAGPETDLGVGISFQIRNASIEFSSGNGSQRVIQDNIGLVPIIKLRAAHWFTPMFGLELEGDGFYASSAIFNGAGRPFEGWIWDAGLHIKTRFFPGVTTFLSLRTIGGGANGTNAYDSVFATSSSAGSSTYNALSTFNLSLGVALEQ